MDRPEICGALKDFHATHRHQDKVHGFTILSVAYPVKQCVETSGAVIIEQTTDEVVNLTERTQTT